MHLGTVEVRNQVVAYQRKQISTNSVIEVCELDLPGTVAVNARVLVHRSAPTSSKAAGIDTAQLIGAVHAAEHGLIGMLPLFTICDRWDVGGVSMAMHPQTGQPTIFVYDGYPGGAGIAELAFEAAARHARATLDLDRRLPVRRRLPVVRAVTEVRQLERVSRQGRRGRAARAHGPRRDATR